ncbi:MAG: class I SAM-dependent methyltransferase [Roseomonas sp.]
MHQNPSFWEFFNSKAAPQLGVREETFRKIFEILDRKSGPLTIVETGCARVSDNWAGDGQSTVLIDKYINSRDADSRLYSVDLSQEAVSYAENSVSNRSKIHLGDSVQFLQNFSAMLSQQNRSIDFLYLDSFDLDWRYWFPSAAHHLKELCAVMRVINKDSLVVVDDCALTANLVPTSNNSFALIQAPMVGGKGRLVAEYAEAVGAKLEFSGYQAGWTGF